MFDITSVFFWYKILFMAELIAAEGLFAFRLERRSRFSLRAGCMCAALMAAAVCIPVPAYNAFVLSCIFFSLFACSLAAMSFCLRTSFLNILFCAVAGYSLRHFAYVLFISLNDAVFYALGIVTGISGGFDPYGTPLLDILSRQSAITVILYLFSYFVVFWAGKYIYADKIRSQGTLHLGNIEFIAIAAVMLFTDVVLSLVTQYNASIDQTSVIVERIYNALTCVLALQLLFSNIFQKEAQLRLAAAEQLLYTQAKQYDQVKKNIDIINIKCHDLKHQLRVWREGGMEDTVELQEIERAVDIYQAAFKTGNEVLDIILTEKSLLCEKSGIILSCIAEGRALGFLRPAELYSLFGNALDNAIEAVMLLPEEQRNIDIFVRRESSLVGIRVENPYAGQMIVKNNAVQTKKKDKNFHGFGILSMRAVVEKYGGTMTIDAAGQIFRLHILFSVPADHDAETTDHDAPPVGNDRS